MQFCIVSECIFFQNLNWRLLRTMEMKLCLILVVWKSITTIRSQNLNNKKIVQRTLATSISSIQSGGGLVNHIKARKKSKCSSINVPMSNIIWDFDSQNQFSIHKTITRYWCINANLMHTHWLWPKCTKCTVFFIIFLSFHSIWKARLFWIVSHDLFHSLCWK